MENKSYKMSAINKGIRDRKKNNDIFITPLPLAKKAIDLIEYTETDIWYDPFKNTGSYYNQFPNENKVWSEILEGHDFFEFNAHVDIICSNPPYSILDPVIKKTIELNPRVINYLIGVNNLTTRRIEMLEKAGYGLTKMTMCKVYSWFGMSYIIQFEKNRPSIIDIDRVVYYND
jgi:hypothetical protein